LITIYYTTISEENHDRILNKYLPLFTSEYRESVGRYRRWQDAQLTLLGRLLLINGLEQMNYKFDESDIKYTTYNKPYLESNKAYFNISHSGEIVVCAITELGDIGIDIEKIGSIDISDFQSQMTDNEWNEIIGAEDSHNSFYRYWSEKEAVIKAHGQGLGIPLKSFEVKNNTTTIGSENFYLQKISINKDYSCHIASKENIEVIDIKMDKINFSNYFN